MLSCIENGTGTGAYPITAPVLGWGHPYGVSYGGMTSGLEIDAYASGGDADTDLPVTVLVKQTDNSLKGTLYGGGAVLKLRSSGGGVSVEGR